MHVLGIDAGGTKTVAFLADTNGVTVGEARGEGANLQADGELQVEKSLHAVMDAAIGDRLISPAAICLGMAGVDREDDLAIVQSIMRRIGFQAKTLVVNDALVALVAGVGHAPGLVVVAGTGSIAYGRNQRGEAARAGGWGYVLGDEGSGYWIGRQALRAVVRQADGRGTVTSLTPRVLSHFGVSKPQELIHQVYHRPLRPAAIVAIASCVQAAVDEGDLVATDILRRGAKELAASAESVARQLDMCGDRFVFVLAGGIFRAVPRLAADLGGLLPSIAPDAEVRLLEDEPAQGAVRLALALAHGAAGLPRYGTT